MRIARIGTGLIMVLFCICLYADMPAQKITVTGKLTRVMAIGGESTGWAIELDSETTIDGKQVNSIEVDCPNTRKLEKLANNRVKVTGMISHRQRVETGGRTVLVVSSIKEAKAIAQVPAKAVPLNLAGSEWLLEDLAGRGVIDNIQATLTFPEAKRGSQGTDRAIVSSVPQK